MIRTLAILGALIIASLTTPIPSAPLDADPILARHAIDEQVQAMERKRLETQVRTYLESKHSPLAPETGYILTKKHWKLLIAISAIESQFCTRKLGLNCWGIGGNETLRVYPDLRAGIDDFDHLITHWQDKGKWLTVEAMNCSYVVPCNPNWVVTVNKVQADLDALVSRAAE